MGQARAVTWIWVLALAATLVGLVVVLRALARVEAAVVALARASAAARDLPQATDGLDRTRAETVSRRGALDRRSTSPP